MKSKLHLLICLQKQARWQKQAISFGSFLDAVNRLEADKNQYPPPRKASPKKTGPEADWEGLIARMNLDPAYPEPQKKTPQRVNQRVCFS